MKRLLVALDDSPRAPEVLVAASRLAAAYAGELIVLRVTAIHGALPLEAYASSPEDIAKVLEARAHEDLERLVAGSPLVRRLRAEEGAADEVIERVAKEENVDAIVIGAHGYTFVERALGTVAARIVERAHCPVFVVREGSGAATAASERSG